MKTIRVDESAHKILLRNKEIVVKQKKASGEENPRASHSDAIRAMEDEITKLHSDKKLASQLCGILVNYAGERGNNEGAVQTLNRLIEEVRHGRKT